MISFFLRGSMFWLCGCKMLKSSGKLEAYCKQNYILSFISLFLIFFYSSFQKANLIQINGLNDLASRKQVTFKELIFFTPISKGQSNIVPL